MTFDGKRLQLSFYSRPSPEVAADLLNKVLVVGSLRGRIVETEAYGGGDDPGSHGYRGITPRTEVVFGKPGLLYVYFTYGMHWCINAVTGCEGESSAVLIRAVQPLAGLGIMRRRRPKAKITKDDRQLCNGPAKLAQAFGLNGKSNGTDLVSGKRVAIYNDGTPVPERLGITKRIGLTAGADIEWRFVVRESEYLSRKYRS